MQNEVTSLTDDYNDFILRMGSFNMDLSSPLKSDADSADSIVKQNSDVSYSQIASDDKELELGRSWVQNHLK